MTAATQPDPDEDELGPIDFLAIEFPGAHITAPGFQQLLSLADQGGNPPWTWDEVVPACDLVVQNAGRSATHPRVTELSRLQQVLPLHPPDLALSVGVRPQARQPRALRRLPGPAPTCNAG